MSAFSSIKSRFNLLTLNSGSRRLLTYRRLPNSSIPSSLDAMALSSCKKDEAPRTGTTANDLNSFRRRVSLLPFHSSPQHVHVLTHGQYSISKGLKYHALIPSKTTGTSPRLKQISSDIPSPNSPLGGD